MAKRKIKTIKATVLNVGEIIDYQTIIEEKVGNLMSKLSCYDPNWEKKGKINGVAIDSSRAYFVPDCDYEIIIRPKK